VRYYDGLTNDARLVLDTLRGAAAARAQIINYVRLEAAETRNALWYCQVH